MKLEKFLSVAIVFAALAHVIACDNAQTGKAGSETDAIIAGLERHVLVLASDEFEGRKPFTPGEIKTVAYLKKEFEAMGFEGGSSGDFFQEVPLAQIDATPSEKMAITTGGGTIHLDFMDDFVASTQRIVEEIHIKDSELVFAGYGIVAPEYDWDDYKNLDVTGKTVVVLVNDPGFAVQDDAFFRGNAMTYYGRWTYKYEEAARQGAEGIMVVHETKAAGYPWTVLQNGAASPALVLQADDNNMSLCALEGWVTTDAAARLFEHAGLSFESLSESAAHRDFKPVPVGARISLSIDNKIKLDTSKNVVALLRGTDRSDECIVYTSHWDHLGIGPAVDGDTIYNGAADNALPLACMLETARMFSELESPPKRSILFVAVTAEEDGLLGSAYYVEHPAFPLEKTVANLNYELFLPLGPMKDVTVYGYGQSELDDYVEAAAKKQNRYVAPDPFPENGMYFRTDHFSFAKKGVPALFVKGWTDHAEHGRDWTTGKIKEYWSTMYHRPAMSTTQRRPTSPELQTTRSSFLKSATG